jgi:hypothetical protein
MDSSTRITISGEVDSSAFNGNAYSGNSAEGGGFWSTRFSAGNSYAGNQTGYVSLPGGDIVGYGD